MHLPDALLMTQRLWEDNILDTEHHGEVAPCMQLGLLSWASWCSVATLQRDYCTPVRIRVPHTPEGQFRVRDLPKGRRAVSRLARSNRHV